MAKIDKLRSQLSPKLLLALKECGWSCADIAREYGASVHTVRQYVRQTVRQQYRAATQGRPRCPRCDMPFDEYPKQADGNCLLCWCERHGINYRLDLLETGIALEAGLVMA